MKYSFTLLGLSTLWATTLAAPHPSPHVVHEARRSLPAFWSKRPHSVKADATIPMRIGLTQSNLDRAHEMLMDVSAPYSTNYGKHYTKDQVVKMFAPSNESVIAVKTWLMEAGIDESRISKSRGRNWLKFDITIAEAEELLHTKYNIYEHESGAKHVGCDSYKVPKHVQDHVDFIVPTVHIDAHVENRGSRVKMSKKKRDGSENDSRKGSGPIPQSKPGAVIPDLSTLLSSKAQRTDLCNSLIFPECLQALYNIPNVTTANPRNSYG